MDDVQAPRRRGQVHGRGAGIRPRHVLQERGRGHRRGPAVARAAAAGGDDRPQLSPLLAVRDAADLRRAELLVRANDRRQGPAARGQRGGRLVSGAHQTRALRRLAREQRGLGAVARTLLGHPAADLAMRPRTRHRDRVARRTLRPCTPRHDRDRPAPSRDRRGDGPVSHLRRHLDQGPGGDRHLVRLRRDALRAMGLSPRARAGTRDLPGALPGRLHRRGDRPDPRLVLHADGRGRAPVRRHDLPDRGVPRAHRRSGRAQDVEVARQHRGRVRGDGPAGCGRAPLVPAHGRLALVVAPGQHGDVRRRRPAVPASAVERVRVLRHVRERERVRPGRGRGHAHRTAAAPGSMGALAALADRGRRPRRPRGVRRDRRRPADRRLRGRPVELVRPARPPAVLGPLGRRRGRRPRRVPHAARMPRQPFAAARALHTVRRGDPVAQPRRGTSRARRTPCTSPSTRPRTSD